MSKRIFTLLVVLALAFLVLTPVAAFAGEKGQAVGQDPVRLALTQCSNAGPGNGAEVEAGILFWSIDSDCLAKRLFEKYSGDEIEALLAQSSCFFIGVWACEVDPGNSAMHNQADGL